MCHATADRHTLGLVEISFFWRSPVCQVQIFSDDVAFLVKILGRSLETFLCFLVCPLVDSDSALSVFYSGSRVVVCLLRWLQNSLSLCSGSFSHMSHEKGRQLLVFGVSAFCCCCISGITLLHRCGFCQH